MIKTLLFALCSWALAASAGDYTVQHIGGQTWVSGPGGYTGFGQRIGNQYFYNDNYGSGYGQRIGSFDFYNYTPNNNGGCYDRGW